MSSTTAAAAFRATTYRVHTPERDFALRIGLLDVAFDDFLRAQLLSAAPGASLASGCGIVTAWNPGGLLPAPQNESRQRRLHARIAASGWRCYAARNIADEGAWPVEPSFLVLPVDAQQIAALGREFHQLAVVYAVPGLAPSLLWI